MIQAVKFINPDVVEVFTVSRPPAEDFIIPVSQQRLTEIAQKFDDALGSCCCTIVIIMKYGNEHLMLQGMAIMALFLFLLGK